MKTRVSANGKYIRKTKSEGKKRIYWLYLRWNYNS